MARSQELLLFTSLCPAVAGELMHLCVLKAGGRDTFSEKQLFLDLFLIAIALHYPCSQY